MKKIKPKMIFIPLGILSLFFILMTYQNCSDVSLSPVRSEKLASLPDSSFCTRAADLYTGQLKVLFVVDMSLSNIGAFSPNFNPATATDPLGIRFAKMTEFIDGCGSINANNKFAILAFSGTALKSTLYGAAGCKQPYLNKAGAKTAVANLAAIQTSDIIKAQTMDPSITMQNTTYLDGLQCAQDTVFNDIDTDPVAALNTTYLVFFLTDGKPSDNCDITNPNAIDANGYCKANAALAVTGSPFVFNPGYEPALLGMMLRGKAKTSDIRFQPIYYGPPPPEETVARNVLDYLAILGESKSTIEIATAGDVDFCTFANSPVRTPFHISEFNIINLTSMMQSEVLLPDSDMDGVIDKDDASPTNPRSNSASLLDGVCLINGGPGSCIKPTGCDLTKISQLHMTDCDFAASSLDDGVDSDQDRIPDLIEALRSTDPILADAFDNLDNDTLKNIEEIHIGRQVDYPDDFVPQSSLTRWTKQIMPPSASCPTNQENWKFTLKQVPLVSTLAYTDINDALFPGSKFNLSHAKDENVIFIYYFVEPSNVAASTIPPELWGTVIKLNKNNLKPSIILNSSDFQKLGTANGKLPW